MAMDNNNKNNLKYNHNIDQKSNHNINQFKKYQNQVNYQITLMVISNKRNENINFIYIL